MLKVTTSWDDGDVLDLKLADLLSRYGIKGTFYIAKDYRPERLSDDDIRKLAKTHEIGAHTLEHPDLRTISLVKRHQEIYGSKCWLEEVTGGEIAMFCYPKGLHDHSVVGAVKDAGFHGARTTELGIVTAPEAPFRLGATIQVYPFPFRKVDKSHYYWSKLLEPYRTRAKALRALGVSFFSMYSWLSMAKAAFDRALEQGGVFHLYGHSWEIEKYGMWEELEELLRYISLRNDYLPVTNGELIKSSKNEQL